MIIAGGRAILVEKLLPGGLRIYIGGMFSFCIEVYTSTK
jgi:hypothetical protein